MSAVRSRKRNESRFDAAADDLTACDRYRQLEPPGPGTSWIDEHDAISPIDRRSMGVSADDECDPGEIDVEILHGMQQMHTNLAELHGAALREILRPSAAIIVAAHGYDACDLTKRRQNFLRADVARMKDEVAPS